MLHKTLRSASGPLSSHACISCILAPQRLARNSRQYYTKNANESEGLNALSHSANSTSIARDSTRPSTNDEASVTNSTAVSGNQSNNNTDSSNGHPTASDNGHSGNPIIRKTVPRERRAKASSQSSIIRKISSGQNRDLKRGLIKTHTRHSSHSTPKKPSRIGRTKSVASSESVVLDTPPSNHDPPASSATINAEFKSNEGPKPTDSAHDHGAEGTTPQVLETEARSKLSSQEAGLEAANVKSKSTKPIGKKKKRSKKKLSRKPSDEDFNHTVKANDLEFKALDLETPPVPNLAFGLDRVLFNPGVYHLRDPRSRVYNFDPYLGTIMPVSEFDFKILKEYVTSSKDQTLVQLAREQKKKYVGSSSSMTSVLCHFHYLLSQWRPIDRSTVSQGFPETSLNFTKLMRGPAAVFLTYKDGVYAIDADKEYDSSNILLHLGKSMEKLLTVPKEEFERYRKSHANKVTPEEESTLTESYHYSTQGDFVMRSQLDAHDPRLPGTGMFDLKTRAVVSIRMNVLEHEKGIGYEIHSRFGNFESYEREYYDMIRAAFLKYSLQVRMGRMDGIFVAFHNVERIFGFQYIPISEMDLALHGTEDRGLGDQEFQLSLKLLNEILDKAAAKFPGRSLRLHFETKEKEEPSLLVFAQPVTAEQIQSIQEKNSAEVEKIEQRVLYPETITEQEDTVTTAPPEIELERTRNAPEADATSGSPFGSFFTENKIVADNSSNTSTMSTVDISPTEMNGEEQAQAPAKLEEIEETSKETNGVEQAQEPAEHEEIKDKKPKPVPDEPTELLCMELSIENWVDGHRFLRPQKLKKDSNWEVKYTISEIRPRAALNLYRSMWYRRKEAISKKTDEDPGFYADYLTTLAEKGREFREQENKLDEEMGIVVFKERRPSSV